jgi:hypothetical protein
VTAVADLFDSPVLLIEQPSPQLSYRVTDPNGVELAHTVQIAGKKKSALKQFFSHGDRSRLTVQVCRPDGAPLFMVDRPEQQQAAALAAQPPCFVVTPDGNLIGRMEQSSRAFAQSWLQARDAGQEGYTQAYQLFDAQGRPLCDMTQEPVEVVRRYPPERAVSTGGDFVTYTDMNQVQIARLEFLDSGSFSKRLGLQLQFQLPDPLRVLVLASPIAMLLMAAAVGGW